MARTPNREHGELLVTHIRLENGDLAPVELPSGGVVYRGGQFLLRDQHGMYDPRGLPTPEDFTYTEITRVQGRLQTVTVWENATRTRKLRETTISRTNGHITMLRTQEYGPAGEVTTTSDEEITRDGSARVVAFTKKKVL